MADLETVYDPERGNFNHLFATASPLINVVDNHDGLPARKLAKGELFLVKTIFTDFKRHDVGPEAQSARDGFAALADTDRAELVAFLSSLVLFPPDDNGWRPVSSK